jgi:hypothetical protein
MRQKRNQQWWHEVGRAGADRAYTDILAAQSSLTVIKRTTVPLYVQRKGHGAPDLVASGVLLSLRNRVFVLTAAHVMEAFGHNAVCIPVDGRFENFMGESYRTPKPKSGTHADDELDAAVFAIHPEHGAPLLSRCADLSDLHAVTRPYDVAYWVYGFPLKWSARVGKQLHSNPRCMTIGGLSADIYERLNLAPDKHILMEAPKRVATIGGLRPQRATKGMSGCGAWIMPTHHGVRLSPKLSGVFIERSRRWPAFIATSVAFHLGQIWQFDEDLRDELEAWSKSESARIFNDWLEKRGEAPSIPEDVLPEWHRKRLGLQ